MKQIFKLEDRLGAFLGYMQLDKGIWFSQNGKNWVPAVSYLQQFEWNWDNIVFQRCLYVNDRGQAIFEDDTIKTKYGDGVACDYCRTSGTLCFKVNGRVHRMHVGNVDISEEALVING